MRAKVGLIAYADRFGTDLAGLRRLLNGPLRGLFGAVHVLPFYRPYDGADAGFDGAFIDNVYLPLPDSSIAARLAILPLPDGQDRLQIQGLSDRAYIIQGSANLTDWVSVSTNVSDNGTVQWTDPQAASFPMRFYRAIAP